MFGEHFTGNSMNCFGRLPPVQNGLATARSSSRIALGGEAPPTSVDPPTSAAQALVRFFQLTAATAGLQPCFLPLPPTRMAQPTPLGSRHGSVEHKYFAANVGNAFLCGTPFGNLSASRLTCTGTRNIRFSTGTWTTSGPLGASAVRTQGSGGISRNCKRTLDSRSLCCANGAWQTR